MALEEFTGALRVRSALASRQVSLEWKNPVVLPCYTGRSIDVVRRFRCYRVTTREYARSGPVEDPSCRCLSTLWSYSTLLIVLYTAEILRRKSCFWSRLLPLRATSTSFFFFLFQNLRYAWTMDTKMRTYLEINGATLVSKPWLPLSKNTRFHTSLKSTTDPCDWSMRSILRVRLGACHDIKLQIWTVCKIVRYDNFIDLWLIDHDNLIDLWFNWLLKANRMYLTKAPLFASFVSTRNRSAKLYRYTGWMLPIEIDGQG